MANKLELTWVGKNEPINIEPRILIANLALSNMGGKITNLISQRSFAKKLSASRAAVTDWKRVTLFK